MSKWNGNRFSVYTSEEKTVLGLIKEMGDQTNYNTDEIERLTESDNKKVSHQEMQEVYKIDKQANFTGSWFGIKKPTQSSEGLAATVDQLIDETIPGINSQLEQKANGNAFRDLKGEKNRNIVCGSIYNEVAEDLQGCVISGGGTDFWSGNVIGGNCDAVGRTDMANSPTKLGTDSNMNTITGGYDNVCNGLGNNISGHHNYTRETVTHSSIAGGVYNKLDVGNFLCIGGGNGNQITGDVNDKPKSNNGFIGGGTQNKLTKSEGSVICGGQYNTITNNIVSAILGGMGNDINKLASGEPNENISNVIIGGIENEILKSSYNSIIGGTNNKIQKGDYSTILGGANNIVNANNSNVIGIYGIANRGNEIVFGINEKIQSTKHIIKQVTNNSIGSVAILFKDNSTNAFSCKVVCKNSNKDYIFFIKGGYKNSSTSKLIGTPKIEKFGDEDTINITTINFDNYLCFNLYGQISEELEWIFDFEFTEVI